MLCASPPWVGRLYVTDLWSVTGITPYRARAHERYSSLYRVPQHVFLTFRATQNEMFEQGYANFFHHTQNEIREVWLDG